MLCTRSYLTLFFFFQGYQEPSASSTSYPPPTTSTATAHERKYRPERPTQPKCKNSHVGLQIKIVVNF